MPDTDAVTLAERRLADAHTAMARVTVDYSRAIADARRDLAEALRALDGPGDTTWGTPPTITEADRRTLHSVCLALGIEDNVRPTALQEVELLRHLPDNLAALLVEHWRSFVGDAERCRWGNHEHQLGQLQSLLNEARTAHDCWNHHHQKEDVARD